MYGRTQGIGGTHTIEQSWEIRTAISGSGKNKEKSPGFGKYQNMVSDVANNILPLYKKQLDASGSILSSKQVSDILDATKVAYYRMRVAARATKLPTEMD